MTALELEIAGDVAVIRPPADEPRFGLTEARIAALHDLIDQCEGTQGLRFLVMEGRGPTFCLGGAAAFILEMIDSPPERRVAQIGRVQSVMVRLRASPLLTVAAVNGLAAGAGVELALACDAMIAGPEARVSLMYNRLGLVPDCGLALLDLRLGRAAGWRAYLDSPTWRASDLAALGVADAVAELPTDAAGWAQHLGRRWRHLGAAFQATKLEVWREEEARFRAVLEAFALRQSVRLGDPEVRSRIERTLALQEVL